MSQIVQIHLQHRRPDTDALGRHSELIAAGERHSIDGHFGRHQADQRSALPKGLHVGHSAAWSLIGQVFLLGGNILLFEQDLVSSTHGDQGFFHAVFHAFDDGLHADQAGRAKHDSQHGEQRAELVRPDFFEADQDGVGKSHGERKTE